MASRLNRTLGRSMIPNYAISTDSISNSPSPKKKRKSKSDFPMFDSEPYKESMTVILKSRAYDKEVQYMIVTIIGILILLSLAPVCIVILKKWKWEWLAKLMGIPKPEPKPISQPIQTIAYLPQTPTITSPSSMMTGTTNTLSSGTPINPTGTGIDINKPYVIPPSALKTFTSTEI